MEAVYGIGGILFVMIAIALLWSLFRDVVLAIAKLIHDFRQVLKTGTAKTDD
jgi:hypothetical protein